MPAVRRPRPSTTRRRIAAATGISVLAAGIAVGAAAPATAYGSPDVAYAQSSAADASLQPYAVDAFGRTVSGSWGTTTASGTWAHAGAGTAFSVANGAGKMAPASTGGNFTSFLAGSSTDTELQAQVGLDVLPVGGTTDLYVVGRAIDASSGYRVKLKVQPTGVAAVSLLRVDGTAAKTIATSTAAFDLASGKDLQVRFQVTGSGTTDLRAKVWAAGTAEPEAWTLTAVDTTPALQAPGGVAFTTYSPAGLSRTPVAAYADVWAGPVAGARAINRSLPAVGTYVPDVSTTGVPAGTQLRVHEGDLTITTPGTVIDGLDVRGFVKVKAKDVTIKNTVVRGRPTTTATGLVIVESTGSLTIEDSELFNATPNWYVDGLRGSGPITARRLNIHDVIDTAHFYGDTKVLEASWLHDTLHYADDPSHSDGTHDDNIQIVKGNDMRIVGNRIDGSYNAAIMVTQGSGTVSNVTVDRNYLGGGSATVNIAESGKGAIQGLKLTGNTFGMDSRKGIAVIAPAATKAVMTTVDNTFTDGTAIVVKNG